MTVPEAPVFRPQSERALQFRGQEIATAELIDGHGYVSVWSRCDAFSLDGRAQRRRLMHRRLMHRQVTQIAAVAGPRARLTPEQRGQGCQSVATLGTLLQEQGHPKPYPGIPMDITRLTGVSRPEDIRQADFSLVIQFLEDQAAALIRRTAEPAP